MLVLALFEKLFERRGRLLLAARLVVEDAESVFGIDVIDAVYDSADAYGHLRDAVGQCHLDGDARRVFGGDDVEGSVCGVVLQQGL